MAKFVSSVLVQETVSQAPRPYLIWSESTRRKIDQTAAGTRTWREARDGAHQAGGRSRDIREVADRRRCLAALALEAEARRAIVRRHAAQLQTEGPTPLPLLEDEEAEKEATRSSFARRVARTASSFVSGVLPPSSDGPTGTSWTAPLLGDSSGSQMALASS
jgi:hypothetical protein